MKTKQLLTIVSLLLAATFTASAQVKRPINTVPFTITKSGNYYLTKDLTVTKADSQGHKSGISIAVNNVTIDLNGRKLTTAFANEGTGIDAIHNIGNVHIRNGIIRGFNDGVYLSGNGDYTVEDVTVAASEQIGIWMHGENCAVRRCVITQTGGGTTTNKLVQGIRIESSYAIVEDCILTRFARDQASFQVVGISLSSGSALVRRNMLDSFLNAGALTTGILTGGQSNVCENTVSGWATGLDLTGDVYRNNAAYTCTTKYSGGTDGGGNK